MARHRPIYKLTGGDGSRLIFAEASRGKLALGVLGGIFLAYLAMSAQRSDSWLAKLSGPAILLVVIAALVLLIWRFSSGSALMLDAQAGALAVGSLWHRDGRLKAAESLPLVDMARLELISPRTAGGESSYLQVTSASGEAVTAFRAGVGGDMHVLYARELGRALRRFVESHDLPIAVDGA